MGPGETSRALPLGKKTHQTSAGEPAHSFANLLAHLGTRTRNTVQIASATELLTLLQKSETSTNPYFVLFRPGSKRGNKSG